MASPAPGSLNPPSPDSRERRGRQRPADELAGEADSVVANSVAPTSTSHFSPENGDCAPGAHATFDMAIGSDVEVLGVPELSLSVTPLAARAFLFGKVYHVSDGEETLINNQVAPVAVEGTPGETRRVEWEPVGFQRRCRAGDTLRLALAATDAGFAFARRGTGVAIHHADSTLSLPVLGTPGGGNVGVSVSASSDGTVSTGGQHTRQLLSVEGGPTFVRDRTLDGRIVAAADRPYTRTSSPATEHIYVEFRNAVTDGDPECVARAPEGPGQTTVYTFGPVE